MREIIEALAQGLLPDVEYIEETIFGKKKNPKTWNKEQMVREIGQKINFSQEDSQRVVDAFVDFVTDAMSKGDKVLISNFGRFQPVHKQKKRYWHPSKKQMVDPNEIPGYRSVPDVHPSFKPAQPLKHKIQTGHYGLARPQLYTSLLGQHPQPKQPRNPFVWDPSMIR